MTAVDIRDKSKLITIHSGVDTGKFVPFFKSDWLRKKYGLSQETVVIGNTSAISDQKDYYTFVKVAEVLISQKRDVRFFIVGDGPDREAIEQFTNDRGLQDVVTFTGFVENITEVLPSLDIFLFTSKTEGLGTSVLDAMAAHVPIVATAAGGVSEMVEHLENGLLYQVKDVDGLTVGVNLLLSDPDLGISLAKKAELTVRNFSKEKTAKSSYELYKEILNS